MEEMLKGFNSAQKEAVVYCDGPSLVIAGAGSGKTRVLTYKVAWLMGLGYEPWSILALTFTNKAADEMKQRVAKIVGEERARMVWMGTFHSVFLRILRVEHDRIGFESNFTIYDTADSKSLLKSVMKEMGLDDKQYKPGNVLARISNAKNQLITAEEYVQNQNNAYEDARAKMPALGEVFRRYSQRLKSANAMDFDDILVYTYMLLEKNEDVRLRYSERFKYVLVDEYQDTNYAQHRIVWLLTKERQKVCVVGDDAQSIYSFRGANIDNILTFQDQYKGSKLFKLEQNYRSTQTIVEAANSLINKNEHRIDKKVFSEKERGEQILVTEAYSDVEEGQVVVKQIKTMMKLEGGTYADYAILYRTNAQSRIFEEELAKNGIPHQIYGGMSFYQRKEIKDALAYMRLAVNRNDEEALKRVINYPARGIGQTTLQKIIDAAATQEQSLWTVLETPLQWGVKVSNGTLDKLYAFKQLIDEFAAMAQTESVDEVGKQILTKSGIVAEIYQDKTPEGLSKMENIEELMNGMTDFVDRRMEEGNENVKLVDYLAETLLLSDTDMGGKSDEPKVSLMTIHSAKGLEFPTVFVVGLEENLFPSMLASGSPREMEEERRLFYVALTRAERHCILSYAKSRFRYGKMEFGRASRFLRDVDSRFLRIGAGGRMGTTDSRNYGTTETRKYGFTDSRSFGTTETRRFGGLGSVGQQLQMRPQPQMRPVSSVSRPAVSSGSSSVGGLSIGQRVLHQKFGEGVVEKVEGTGENTKAYIRFANAGLKQLLLKFAKLEKL